MNLKGNTIFITGGGSGIGRGLAEALLAKANKVIISGRRISVLEEVTKANPGMDFIELNIEDPKSIALVAASLTKKYPALNVLINNAGIMKPDAVQGVVDDSLVVSMVTTNLLGPIRMTSALIEHLKSQPSGLCDQCDLWAGFRSAGHHGNLLRDQGGATFILVIAALSVEGYECKGTRTGSALCSDRTDGRAAGQ